MAAWCPAGDDQRAITGAAVTRPCAATVATSSASHPPAKSNREKNTSRASSTDFICK